MAQTTEINTPSPSLLPPLPALSINLTNVYNGLTIDNRKVFIKVFRFIWRVVNGRRSNVVPLFWAVDLLRLRYSLTSSELTVLSYLYQLSYKGKVSINSDLVYNGFILQDMKHNSKLTLLDDLKLKGYLIRSRNKPATRLKARSFNKHPVYLSLSPSGVALIEGMEKDLYNILLRSSLNDITGRNKKPD